MRKRMGKFPEERIRKGLRNKATSDFLVMCGLKKPERDTRKNGNFIYQNEGRFLDTNFSIAEPVTVEDFLSDFEINLLRKFNIKECYVKLTKIDDMLDIDIENDSDHDRENEASHIICQFCNEEFTTIWSRDDHIATAHIEQLTCDVCSKFFKTPKRLQAHKKSHTTVHQCRLCSQCFTSTFLLDTHFLSVHSGLKPFTCKLCPEQFSLGSLHKEHEKSHRKRNSIQTTDELSHLKKHIQVSRNEKKLTCKVCGMKHISHSSLMKHLLTHENFECSKCGQAFLKKSYLRNHVENECSGEPLSDNNASESEGTLFCQFCSKQYATMRNLNRHMFTFHSENVPYYCEDCHTRFETDDMLKKHVHIKCKLCDQNFSNIETHMLKSHSADLPYHCAVCGAAFTSVTRMRQHAKSHNDEFHCEYCFKTFNKGHQLEYHVLKKHVVEKSFTCNVCEKSYPSTDILKEHKKIVHTEDSFECDFCNRTFNKFLLLEKHITKLHASGKSLQCDFCPKKYSSYALLKTHEKFHFTSFECVSCSNVFKASDCLKKHIKEDHGNEAVKDELLDFHLPRCLCCSRTFKNSDCLKKHVDKEHDSYFCSTHNNNVTKQQPVYSGERICVKEEYTEYENATNSYEYCSNF